MIIFPIYELMGEQNCYDFLIKMLHPDGLHCPNGHPLPSDQAPHDRHRDPIFDYKCRVCGKVYNIFTNTVLSGIRYSCVTLVLILRGIAQGVPTKHLAEELGIDRSNLLELRHAIQNLAMENLPRSPLPDSRANKNRGIGTMENDRPPVLGVVGRTSGQIRLTVCENTQKATIQPQVETHSEQETTLYTDENSAYDQIDKTGRGHAAVCHSKKEWARDDDGDGIREVHCNTLEGLWTGLRNFLRPFRGVHKKFLATYAAIFEWAYNLKQMTPGILSKLDGKSKNIFLKIFDTVSLLSGCISQYL